MPEWVIPASLVAIVALVANSIYGLYLVLLGPPTAPISKAELWYIVFFGLQSALGLKLDEYCNRGTDQFLRIVLCIFGGILALILILGLIERITGAGPLLFTFGCIAAYAATCAAAILIRPHVIHSR